MIDITVKNYTDTKVCFIKISNKKLFWIKMNNIQNGLGVKNMTDLRRKEIHGILRLKILLKVKSKNKKDVKMLRIIKTCRGKKKQHDFRCKLGFTLHYITMSKEEPVTIKIIKTFSNKKITWM